MKYERFVRFGVPLRIARNRSLRFGHLVFRNQFYISTKSQSKKKSFKA